MNPFVSVVIPCRNEAAALGRCLDSVLAGDYEAGRLEVVVADGASNDGSREIVEQYAALDSRVRLVDNPQKTTPVGLNLAIAQARGEFVVRVDAHATLSSNYLSECISRLTLKEADCVGGVMQTVAREETCFGQAIQAALSHMFGVGNSKFRTGVTQSELVDTVFCPCWPREVLERIGPFNPSLERGQDLDFSQRLRRSGGRILLFPEAHSVYPARSRWLEFLRHNWNNGVWAILPWAYAEGSPVRWRHLVPLAFVAGLCAAPLTVGLLYVCLNAVCSVSLAVREKNPRLAALLPLTFLGLHLSYGLGSWWGVLRLGRRLL